MTYEEVIKFYGGTQQKVADALGVRQSAISAWSRNGRTVPHGVQCEIQLSTGGALRAGEKPQRKRKPQKQNRTTD